MARFRPGRKLRILDFDIENRPLSYLGSDFTTAEITAIAWSLVGDNKVEVRVLEAPAHGEYMPLSGFGMLLDFVGAYNAADIVTGHYIRMHDLPIINGALAEWEMPKLEPKLVSDTKVDLVRMSGISKSQENLAAMYGIAAPKVQMNQIKWRQANRLTREGIELTKERVIGDVKQHKQLRAALIADGKLGPPTLWKP